MELIFIRWNINPEIFRIGGFALRYYSVLFAIAFILGYLLVKRMYQKEGRSLELLHPLFIYLIAGTLIGARLGQVLFYEFDYFKQHPLQIILPFQISSKGFEWTGYQGLASHGGAIGVLVALALYCRKYHQPFLSVLDKVVIAVALAGFFIRTGNLFNSEILGKPSDVPWAFVFERVDLLPRHPSQLYEAIAYFFIFLVLWGWYQRKGTQLKTGFLFGLFLVLVFSARFLIEFSKEAQEAFERTL
ncbi:MAG TPA: prolipoprotein diacylglyceryl transferase, partial [Flavisolibacter sp.]|nr:prolipoprotein diacylglyceryl transferase [Flavisolibacter sp.]